MSVPAAHVAVPRTAGPRLRMVSGEPVPTRFMDDVPNIVSAVLSRIDAELPEFRDAGWRGRAADEALLIFELYRRLELSERDREYSDADISEFAVHFRAMARRGAPLRAVQRFCRATVAHTFTELWGRAEPGDVAELLRMSRWLSRHNGVVERLLVQVYCEQLDATRPGLDRAEAMAERLLAGMATPDAREQATPYLVVAHERPSTPADGLPAGTLLATRSTVRYLLVPVGPHTTRNRQWTELARWTANRRELHAAGVYADGPAEVPGAAAAALRLLRTAGAVALPPGLVGATDLVLESTLAGRSAGLLTLSAVLDPLDDDERLMSTLVAFLANDLDRTGTAAALFLSRGGLSLRLDRIMQLTGLDPRSTRGIQVLSSALSARALREVHDDGDGDPLGVLA